MNIKILCTALNPKAERLCNILQKYANTEIIAHNGVQDKNFRGLTSRNVTSKIVQINNQSELDALIQEHPFLKIYHITRLKDPFEFTYPQNQFVFTHPFTFEIPQTTAWDLAFKDIEIEDTIFIEDDVAANETFWKPFFKFLNEGGSKYEYIASDIFMPSQSDAHLMHWKYYRPVGIVRRSFNPFCVLKASLVHKVLDFQKQYGCFVFHEILFAGLANNHYDLRNDIKFNLQFFHNKMDTKIPMKFLDRALVHPVKLDTEHKKVCENLDELAEVIIPYRMN